MDKFYDTESMREMYASHIKNVDNFLKSTLLEYAEPKIKEQSQKER